MQEGQPREERIGPLIASIIELSWEAHHVYAQHLAAHWYQLDRKYPHCQTSGACLLPRVLGKRVCAQHLQEVRQARHHDFHCCLLGIRKTEAVLLISSAAEEGLSWKVFTRRRVEHRVE